MSRKARLATYTAIATALFGLAILFYVLNILSGLDPNIKFESIVLTIAGGAYIVFLAWAWEYHSIWNWFTESVTLALLSIIAIMTWFI